MKQDLLMKVVRDLINNVYITTNDLTKAELFYDIFLALFGATKTRMYNNSIMWRTCKNSAGIVVSMNHCSSIKEIEGNTKIALQAGSSFEVSLIHKAALRIGATCAGKPKINSFGQFSASILDADYNKFIICHNG